jgi:hypothetical protein
MVARGPPKTEVEGSSPLRVGNFFGAFRVILYFRWLVLEVVLGGVLRVWEWFLWWDLRVLYCFSFGKLASGVDAEGTRTRATEK